MLPASLHPLHPTWFPFSVNKRSHCQNVPHPLPACNTFPSRIIGFDSMHGWLGFLWQTFNHWFQITWEGKGNAWRRKRGSIESWILSFYTKDTGEHKWNYLVLIQMIEISMISWEKERQADFFCQLVTAVIIAIVFFTFPLLLPSSFSFLLPSSISFPVYLQCSIRWPGNAYLPKHFLN